jgi:hypothetical protein
MILENCCSESAESMTRLPRPIAPDEYLEYATSNRPIVRFDDEEAGLCGLLDTETGERFVIESERLMRFSIRSV